MVFRESDRIPAKKFLTQLVSKARGTDAQEYDRETGERERVNPERF
jgi:hypothetical protein